MDWHPIQGGVQILPVTLCYRNQAKLQPDGPLGLYADFTFTYLPTLENCSKKRVKFQFLIFTQNIINQVQDEQQ